MNILELMDSRYKSFTKTDLIIYNGCKKNPPLFARGSISEITAVYGVSQPALTRFAKRLDLSGFNEFQFQLEQCLKDGVTERQNETHAEKYAHVLKAVEDSTSLEQVRSVAEKIYKSDHFYLHGNSLSEVPPMYLTKALGITGAAHADLLELSRYSYRFTNRDVIMDFSVTGQTIHTVPVNHILYKKNHKPYQILITMNPKHPLKAYFDEIILLPDSQAVYGSEAACSDTMAFMMFCDMLITELNRLKESE